MALPYVTAYLVARPNEAFPIEHPYVAEFYTPILGPTCVALLRWTAGHLTPGKAVPVDLAELAVRLGLQPSLGRNAPLMRTLRRLCLYNVAAWNPEPDPDTDGHLLIADHLPPVSTRQAARWPAALTAEHQSALARHRLLDRSA
ncbi:MAG: hypothetical protein ACKV2O_22010 [Acidimicrobiales bacterium]